MKKYKGYLIDLDGTMYKGDEEIEAAAPFVKALSDKGIPYLFLTNNSTSTQIDVADKLQSMGIIATPQQVFTSSLATVKYIKYQNPNAICYVIGEKGLYDAFEQEGIMTGDHNCDYVVIGLDRQITYEKLATAALAIRRGAKLISTNSDIAIPTEQGLVPGNGSLTAVLTVSTGKEPIFIGKPEEIIMNEALSVLGRTKDETLMVGDNYDTDITAGIRANIDTLMTFTGLTPFSAYETLPIKPTYYVHSLNEWIKHI